MINTVKRNIKRCFAAALSAVIILCCFLPLCSCSGGGEKNGETVPTIGSTTAQSDGETPITDLCGYSLIRAEGAGEYEKAVIAKLFSALREQTGGDVVYTDDFFRPADGYDRESRELLVGITNRDECRDVLEKTPYNGYSVCLSGNKLVVTSWSVNGLICAVDELTRTVRRLEKDSDGRLPLDVSKLDGGTVSELKSEMPVFDGMGNKTVSNCGDGAYQLTVNKSARTDFEAYLGKLGGLGYTKIQENSAGGNTTVSLVSEEKQTRLTVSYVGATSCLRVVSEKYREYGFSFGERGNVPVTVIAGTACNRIYYIRLSDGSFVIIDGNNKVYDDDAASEEAVRKTADALVNELADICGSREDIRISAWILTHLHPDHINMLCGVSKYYGDTLRLERVIYNFPSGIEMKMAKDDGSRYLGIVSSAVSGFRSAPQVIKPHTGQIFTMAGTEFEFIFTHEDIYPSLIKSINQTSCVFLMREGNSTVLWTGDMDDNASAQLLKTHADRLDCDAVEIGHHGWNGGGTVGFYRKCSPAVMLWNIDYKEWKEQLDSGILKNSGSIYNLEGVTRHMWCCADPRDTLTLPLK